MNSRGMSQFRTCRVLIVDDEPPARRHLRRLLAGRTEIELVGEYGDGRSAVEGIEKARPDLVFLDIQMPELDGLEVVQAVGPERMPEVVFVTAYDAYALEAFAVNALDYLLKPFEDERFHQTLERALERLRQRRSEALCERLACLVEGRHLQRKEAAMGGSFDREASARDVPLRRLVVEKGGRLFLLPVVRITWIEAEGAYVRLHTGHGTHLIRDSLKRLEKVLDGFVRVHRSSLVNAERVTELRPLFRGEYEVVLEDGTCLKLSRGYRDRLPLLLR